MNKDEIMKQLKMFSDGIALKSVHSGFYKEVKKEADAVLEKLGAEKLKSDLAVSGAVGQLGMQVTVLENQWQTKLTEEEKKVLRELRSLTDNPRETMIGTLFSLGMFR